MYTLLFLGIWFIAGCYTVKAVEKQLRVELDSEVEALIIALFPLVLVVLLVRGYLLKRGE